MGVDMAKQCLLEYGQKIVFLGDSITEARDGYVGVVESIIGALIPDMKLTYINAGISGNRVTDMLDRMGESVIAHYPDWTTISVGINDVWHGVNGVPIEAFRDKYDEMIDRLSKQTVSKLALFTTTVIGEELDSEANVRLVEYNEHIRKVAKKKKALLVEMNGAFHRAIDDWHKIGTELRFTTDGVHTNPVGAYLMAHTLAKAWGVL
jgi:acyl-CoA thioesterase I